MIRFTSETAAIEEDLEKYEKMPSLKTVLALETALAQTFAQTQADTDVITGSLKASGRTSSEVDRATHTWEGLIEYGGDSPGFANAYVDYAKYERARGGGHDFLRSVRDFDANFREAMSRA